MSRLRPAPALIAVCLLAGCTTSNSEPSPVEPSSDPLKLTANVADGTTKVAVDTVVRVDAEHGQVVRATLEPSDGKDRISGRVVDGQWVASQRLEPGTRYQLKATGLGDDGEEQTTTSAFRTRSLTLDQQTYPAVAPLDGEKVGVGMPVIVTFDVPVKNRELYEKNMHVTVDGDAVDGSWSWFSDRVVHYRPQHYWKAGSKVNVKLDLNSLPAGGGVFGQQDQDIDFTIGPKNVSVVDVDRHQLRFTVDGRTVKRIPVSTGDATHQTRNGTKIIMEKFSSVDMDAATTGVDSEDPGYYNISDVRWAMRLTNSGEFIHAAPWSVASQGNANVSHGCTGMSTANAAWLYRQSRRGDVVRYEGSRRGLEDRNGWTDWNVDWKTWLEGSALPDPDTDDNA